MPTGFSESACIAAFARPSAQPTSCWAMSGTARAGAFISSRICMRKAGRPVRRFGRVSTAACPVFRVRQLAPQASTICTSSTAHGPRSKRRHTAASRRASSVGSLRSRSPTRGASIGRSAWRALCGRSHLSLSGSGLQNLQQCSSWRRQSWPYRQSSRARVLLSPNQKSAAGWCS